MTTPAALLQNLSVLSTSRSAPLSFSYCISYSSLSFPAIYTFHSSKLPSSLLVSDGKREVRQNNKDKRGSPSALFPSSWLISTLSIPALPVHHCRFSSSSVPAPRLFSLHQAKRAPRAAFPSGCLAAQTKRWAEGIRVQGPLAGGGSTTARGKLRLCPASACQTGLPWSSPPA